MARKAAALNHKGLTQESIEMYKAALLENNDIHIKDALKRVEKKKKEDEAKAYINPEIAEEHNTKGKEFFKAGTFPAAIKEFDEGMRRDPKSKAILSNRCAAYIKLMEPQQAL